MDKEKLITVVVWATIVLVVYELFQSIGNANGIPATAANLGLGSDEVLG